jgi:hypothetical protein
MWIVWTYVSIIISKKKESIDLDILTWEDMGKIYKLSSL